MAKKQRVESVDARPPEFDKMQYIRRELLDSRLSFIVIVFALLMGGVSGALFGTSAGLAAVAGLAGMLALPFLFRAFGIDLKKEFLSDEKKKLTEDERKAEFRGYIMKNIGQMGMYFLTWLAIFVLAVNIPVMDNSAPAYLNVKGRLEKPGDLPDKDWVDLGGGEIKIRTDGISGRLVNITAMVTDNTGVASVIFTIDGTPKVPKRSGDNYWVPGLDPNKSPLEVRISAKDTLGHASSLSFKVIIQIK